MATKTRRLADLLANIDDNSKVTSGGLLDATITATDLADDSVGAAEIIDDAVGAAAIADDAVGADQLASNAVVSASIVDANITAAKLSSTALAAVENVKPHIQPGMLYPSYVASGTSNKLLDGTTAHSGAFGTAQSDGRKYYYTNIAGSKPIKDPRIGAHFGSQRHKAKSIQILEQETAAHGKTVHSVDGREWCRVVSTTSKTWGVEYKNTGNFLQLNDPPTDGFIEITGYFNDINYLGMADTQAIDDVDLYVNGALAQAGNTTIAGRARSYSPLRNRHVDNCCLIHGGSMLSAALGTAPTINTLKILATNAGSEYFIFSGFELIAQHRGSNTGSDIAPNNSATSMGSLTEANATAGWTNTNFGTFESAAVSAAGGTPPTGVGTYALHLVAAANQQYCGTGAITTVVGTRYRVTFHYKVTNGSTTNYVALYGGTAAGNGNIFGEDTHPDSDWHSHVIEFQATTTSFFLTIQEGGGSGNASNIYIAGVTFFALTDTELSQVQIPAQNVISYGKKFAVSAATPHYDPFNGFTSGNLAAVQALVDTATSLGVEGWNHSSTYYRPYNGGRVVRWIDSSGAIKTSVNMMPPNARSMKTTAIAAKANASVANTLYYPTFEAGAIDHSLAEVAKTFHWREFGNGAANGGQLGTYADASMSWDNDDIAYVMDDGLTSLHSKTALSSQSLSSGQEYLSWSATVDSYVTFVGTGLSLLGKNSAAQAVWYDIAQNLPYGTHILKRENSDFVIIDGISFAQSSASPYAYWQQLSFHQPKMPSIPEDAVVISDYMLMADTVQIPNATAALDGHISKGMLRKSISRDYLIHPNSGSNVATFYQASLSLDSGFLVQNATGQTLGFDLPHFGTKFMVHGENAGHSGWGTSIYGGTAVTQTMIDNTDTGNAMDKFSGPSVAKDLGINTLQLSVLNGYGTRLVDFNTPIHTSSHYQPFESPFLYELVGGDRNMEQTNLIVSPDGKSWDEMTRDTSYIGNVVVNCSIQNDDTGSSWSDIKWNMWRGTYANVMYYNKDWCISYGYMICLVDGTYSFTCQISTDGNASGLAFFFNDVEIMELYATDVSTTGVMGKRIIHCKRGDMIRPRTKNNRTDYHRRSSFMIERL